MDYFDLGSFHRKITTTSEKAQLWFNRGLVWSYAFNHEEAARCFRNAIAEDPRCAMAYWGLAYTIGPNYNKPWEFFDEVELQTTLNETHQAAENAKANAATATPVEKALADAIRFRYSSVGGHERRNQEYADAMATVYESFSDDLDVVALYADALMNLTPWSLWDLKTGKPAQPHTLLVKEILDRALDHPDGYAHPGILHLYIHLMEMSPTPEQALNAADHLRGLIPDAGHLHHMPTHLDILCGDYRRAMASSLEAIKADERFVARAGPVNFYTLYRAHNYHFRIYAAMFAGQSRVALETVSQLEKSIPEELLRIESPPMADWLEGFLAIRVHVLIRFGRWEDIIKLDLPKDQQLYSVSTAMIHYAKGVAFAATGKINEAEGERTLFHTASKSVPSSRMLFNNTCTDILAIAASMLDGELEYRRGNINAAFDHLRESISIDDNLPYDEPWGWMQPTRHAYAALMLEQGQVEDAAAVYRADLGIDDSLPRALQHPNNVWALHGYHECLVRLSKTGEAQILQQQLKLAIATADVPIKASCFCRISTENCPSK